MGCIKDQYETYKKAMQAANGVHKRIGQYMKVYKCEYCGRFHIATKNKRWFPKIKDDKYPIKKDYKKEKKLPEPQINFGYKPQKQQIHTGYVIKIKEK